MQGLFYAVANLHGKPLLDLQAAGEGLDHAGYLAKSGDFPVRDVGDVAFSDERHHMMLASAIQVYVFHENHLLVFLVENGAADNLHAVFLVAFRYELQCLGHSLRGLYQSLSFGVLAQKREYGFHVPGYLLGSGNVESLGFLICHDVG